MRKSILCVVVGCLALVVLCVAWAHAQADSSPEQLFKDKGLIKSGFMLILKEEATLHSATNDLRTARGKTNAEDLKRKDLQAKLAQAQKDLDLVDGEILRAAENLANHPNDNAAIGTHNAVLQMARQDETRVDTLRTQLLKLTSSKAAYITKVLETAKIADADVNIYDAPAKDAALAAAITTYNQTHRPALKLGPSADFREDLDFIAKCKADVSSDSIPINTDHGVPVVDVLINGKTAQSMIWDSGCTGISLSAKTAKALGLHPSDSDPIEEGTIADGRTIREHVKVLDSIRIGAFTVENLRCTIPPEGSEGADLLGGEFQSNFQFKLDMAGGTLQLTPLYLKPEVAAAKKPVVAGVRTVDLLENLKPGSQAVRGNWTIRNGGLYSDDQENSCIDLNYCPGEEYDCKMTFSRVDGDDAIDLIVCANGRQFSFMCSGWNGTLNGFREINAKHSDVDPNSVHRRLFQNGDGCNVVVKVRTNEVAAYFNGQLIERYATDFRDMGLDHEYTLHRPDTLGIATWKSVYAISSVQVTEIKGTGTFPTNSDKPKVHKLATASYVLADESRTVTLFDNGHFEDVNSHGKRWFLRGTSLIFRWDDAVDVFTVSADGKTFDGLSRDHKPIHGEILSGAFTPQAVKPADPGKWVVLFRSDDPTIWNLSRGSPTDANGFAADVDSTAPEQTRYLQIKKGSDAVIIPITSDQLVQKTDIWCGTDWNGYRAFHLGIKNPAMKKLEKGVVDIDDNFLGWGFGHIEYVDGQGYSWAGKAIPRTVMEISVKSGDLTESEKKLLAVRE